MDFDSDHLPVRAKVACNSARPLQESPGPFRPGTAKSLGESLPGPLEKVSEAVSNSLQSLKTVSFETPRLFETASDTFRPRGRKAPGDSLEDRNLLK